MLKGMAGKAKNGELALIERIRDRAGVGSDAVRLGIGDDCAILRPRAGDDLVVTTDFTLEGRHFRRGWHTARSVGHRTLARGLSDLAAMGANSVLTSLDEHNGPGFAYGIFAYSVETDPTVSGGFTMQRVTVSDATLATTVSAMSNAFVRPPRALPSAPR